ncbi:643_t:CDS:2, partial [Scutellospora calospora]
AHEHSTNLTGDIGATDDPIDGTLWAHIIFMSLAFGIIFPIGMVLGLSRSRYHVPLQIIGTFIATLGYFLGHAHEGRQFASDTAHASFATYVMLILIGQVFLGLYLKCHFEKNFNQWIRPMGVKFHKVIGICMPVIGYIQIVFGVITATGWCRGNKLGQCLAHFIMGSSFMAHGILLILIMRFATEWLRRKGRSQDYYDSWNWTSGDFQHTLVGIMWWSGGLLGIYLSRKGVKRNIIPSVVIIFTGYILSQQTQTLAISTDIHRMFGITLIGAGIARLIEVCFVVVEKPITPFRSLCPYLMIISGLLFMGAHEDQVLYLSTNSIDAFSYALIQVTIAFFVFFAVNVMIDLYWMSGTNDGEPKYEIIGNIANENLSDNSRGNNIKDVSDRNTLEGRNGMDGGDGGIGRFESRNTSFIDDGHISVNLNDDTVRNNDDNVESDDGVDERDGKTEKNSDGFVVNYLLVSQHADEKLHDDDKTDEM